MKNKLKKVFAVVMTAAMLLTCGGITAFAAERTNEDEEDAEVIVTVYVNNHDEDYILNIPFDDGTVVGDYDYSIEYIPHYTRDPIYLTYFFDYVGWITRDGVVSLSLDPTSDVRNNTSSRDSAWNILKDPTYGVGGSPKWPTATSNVKTFRWQYDCHWSFAKNKDYWNIEPSRTASNYAAVVLASCNP